MIRHRESQFFSIHYVLILVAIIKVLRTLIMVRFLGAILIYPPIKESATAYTVLSGSV